jgi:uncharacterized FlaG/YvyC family protein
MPDGFRVERIRAELPALRIPRTVTSQIGRIAEGNILDNIKTQKRADHGSIKANAPSTLERKRRLGRGTRSLVDELHRFVQGNRKSWRWTASKKAEKAVVTIVPATAQLRRLVRFVQEKGYVGWFALSDDGREAIRQVIRKWIRREFDKARRARRRARRSR